MLFTYRCLWVKGKKKSEVCRGVVVIYLCIFELQELRQNVYIVGI